MNIKTLVDEELQDNGYWSYRHAVYQADEQPPVDYFYGQTNGTVVIIPVTEEGDIVCIQQYRYIHEKHGYEFPAGGINSGETPTEAAARELQEETGYVADHLVKVGEFEPASILKATAHVYITPVSKQVAHQREVGEIMELAVRSVDDLDQMMREGKIWDGHTICAWSLARHFLKQREQASEEVPTIGRFIKELLGT